MFTEAYYIAESRARDILSSQGVEFGGEMTPDVDARLHALTLQVMNLNMSR